jgi:acyl-CoA dehydrogenase
MYIGTSVLRRFQADGSKKEDLPYVHFSMNYALFEIQKAFDGIFDNLSVPGLTWFFKGPIRWWSGLNTLASESQDSHTHKLATLITTDSEQRDRITDGIFMPKDLEQQLRRLDHTFKVVKRAEGAEKKVRDAVKKQVLPKKKIGDLINIALEKGIINRDEQNDLINAEALRYQAIQVDDFSDEEYLTSKSTMTTVPPAKNG